MINFTISIYDSDNDTWISKYLWEIMDPNEDWSGTLEQQLQKAYRLKMLPTSYKITAETYCKDADRTANYELEKITNINYKVKPEFTWSLLRAEYVRNLLTFLKLKDNYKNNQNVIVPEEAPIIKVTFEDLLRERTISAYLGQSIDIEYVEYDNILYAQDFRIAFPER